jgi:hypothetical protein
MVERGAPFRESPPTASGRRELGEGVAECGMLAVNSPPMNRSVRVRSFR